VAPILIRFERFPVFHTSTSGGGHDYNTLIEADFLNHGGKFEAGDFDDLWVDKQIKLDFMARESLIIASPEISLQGLPITSSYQVVSIDSFYLFFVADPSTVAPTFLQENAPKLILCRYRTLGCTHQTWELLKKRSQLDNESTGYTLNYVEDIRYQFLKQ
jgi:hypothetical protein